MLKVSSPQPPMDMPPMNMGDGQTEEMGDNMQPQPPMDMPPMNMGDGQTMGDEFDTNFDAGVDADEETDPKKYIQQLTGKLSQTLRKYNSDQAQPDAELSKYVCGMIVKQAIESLNTEDVDEILKKIKSDDDFEKPVNDMGDGQTEEMGDNMQPQPSQINTESIDRKKQIDEVFQELINNTEKKESYETNKINNSFRKKPFTSPKFK